MKTLISFLVVLLFTSASVIDTPTKEERKFAVKYLSQTQQDLAKAIKGLSAEQLQFKATPENWSIAQCLEHIAIAEVGIFGRIKEFQQKPADASKRSEIKFTHAEELIKVVTDRSEKVKAPEFLQPTGKYESSAVAFEAFNKQRNETKKWIEETQDDLHNHLLPHPLFGQLDSYQWVILIGAHCKRHTLQIEEVKEHPQFPSK